MKVAFLVNDLQLSGGVGVVLQHARHLSARPGWDITIVVVREEDDPRWTGYEHLPHLHVRSRTEALSETYDVAVATWWETVFTLFQLSARRYAYFVQSLEDRFYGAEEAERLGAALTLDLPVAFITEARWIVRTLSQLRPEAPCYLVRNGIDKAVFTPIEAVTPSIDGPLRILIEGSPRVRHKGVADAVAAAAAMREAHHVTAVCADRNALAGVEVDRVVGPLSHREMASEYADSHVVLKLSRVEGMFGPPLEGFHLGATCVVTPVTGHEEYVEHGFNGLLTDWDDLGGTARQLDILARDRGLLHLLRTNALATARAWPDWGQASQFMAAALSAIAREPPPDVRPAAARMLADLRAGLDGYQGHLSDRRNYARRLRRYRHIERALRKLGSLRHKSVRRARRLAGLLLGPVRPLITRARRRTPAEPGA